MTKVTFVERFYYFLNRAGYPALGSQEVLGLRVFFTDLSRLRLRFSAHSPLIEVPASMWENRSPREILGTLKDVVLHLELLNCLPIVLVEGQCDELRSLVNKPPYRMIALRDDEMQSIIASPAPSDRLLASIRTQVPLAVLSPYEVSAPVTDSGFFGRSLLIHTLQNHPGSSFAIIGTRRIGKTSLLKEMQRRMADDLPHSQRKRLMYFDCMAFTDTQSFIEGMISELYPPELNRKWRQGNFAYFPQFMKRMATMYEGPITLFMDEVDYLLRLDRERNYELTRILRACFEEGSCRFLFAGFREARREIADGGTPCNFATPMPIGNFSPDETAEVVTVPLESMGVRIVRKDDVIERICSETDGHPNFVQYYCRALIGELDRLAGESRRRRRIGPENLDGVVDDEGFRIRILDAFISNTNDLEKAAAYAVSDMDSFSIEDMDRQMKRRRFFLAIGELEEVCNSLKALGVVEEQRQTFKFTIPVFPRLLRERWGERFVFDKANEYLKLTLGTSGRL